MPKLRRKSALKRKDESKLLMREARQTAETEDSTADRMTLVEVIIRVSY